MTTKPQSTTEPPDQIWISSNVTHDGQIAGHSLIPHGEKLRPYHPDTITEYIRANLTSARSVQHLVNQWQAAWLSTQDISRDSEADLVRRIEAMMSAAALVEQSEHDSCSHWREGDSDNCVWCGDDLGPTTDVDVNEGAR